MVNGNGTAQQQLREWRLQAEQKKVAHAQVSTRAEHRQFWSTLTAGVLAVFTGSVWTADLADTGIVPSTAVQWVAAMAAFLAAILLAVTAAANWKQDQDDHAADKRLWAVVDSDIDHMQFDPDSRIDKKALAKLEADRAAARDKEHNLTPHELAKAMKWIRENRPELLVR